MGEIKYGQYGRYYEYEQNGEIKRLSLSNINEIKIQHAEQLVEGKTVHYRKSIKKQPVKRGSVYYGWEYTKAYLVPYINKQGKETQIIKEETEKITWDTDIVNNIIFNNLPREGETLNEYTSRMNQLIIDHSEDLNDSLRITFRHHNEHTKDWGLMIEYYDVAGGFTKDPTDRVFVVSESDKIILKIVEDENELAKLRLKCKKYREQREAEKKEQELKERLEKEREKIAKIRALPWEEITLEDYEKNSYADADAVREWLMENTDGSNIERKVLFKKKRVSSWTNKNPYRTTMSDQGGSTSYIADVIPGFPKQYITMINAYPIASSYLREASDYAKSIEPDTIYEMEYTLHGTD